MHLKKNFINMKKNKTIRFSNFIGDYSSKYYNISIHSKTNNYGIGEKN